MQWVHNKLDSFCSNCGRITFLVYVLITFALLLEKKKEKKSQIFVHIHIEHLLQFLHATALLKKNQNKQHKKVISYFRKD